MQFGLIALFNGLLILATASGINRTQFSAQNFTVHTAPVLRAVLYSGSTPVNPDKGTSAGSLGGLRCVVETDEKSSTPDGAKYQIKAMDIILARGTSIVQKISSINGQPNLNGLNSQTRPGDRVVFNVKKVVLINSDGKEEIVQLTSGSVISIPIF